MTAARCWLWDGSHSGQGYGQFWGNGRTEWAHRVVYEALVGPIPDGLQIDHLCRNPGCVNPGHLEVVTSRENTLRGVSMVARNAKKTRCPSGHPYDEKNTYRDKKEKRHCRICMRAGNRRYQKRRHREEALREK